MVNNSIFDLVKDDFEEDFSFVESVWADCRYYTLPEQLGINGEFNVLHINARSVKNKIDHIYNFLMNSGVDWSIVCVSETWLNEHTEHLFQMDGFSMYACSRLDGVGGGTAIYVNTRLESNERIDLKNTDFEACFIEVSLQLQSKKKRVIIGSIYKPPSSNSNVFLEYLEKLLNVLERETCCKILAGDFNFDLNNVKKDKHSVTFSNLLLSYGFLPTISQPTRVDSNSSALLDNIFVNDMSFVAKSGVIIDDMSDHFPIFTSFIFKCYTNEERRTVTIFDKTKMPELDEHIRSKLANFETITDANRACDCLINAYKTGINKLSKTYKPSRRRTPLKPWISPAILCSINVKNKLYAKYLKNKTVVKHAKYKQYRNILTNILRNAKRLYYQKELEANKCNGKETWKLLNEAINKRNTKPVYPKSFKGTEGNDMCGIEIPEGFNNFFSSIGLDLDKKIPHTDGNPIDYLPRTNGDIIPDMHLTNDHEIELIIKSLNHVGGGIDKISTRILLGTYKNNLSHLTFFYNLCLRTGVFPDQLKIAVIVPIFKAGEKNLFTNYRPISLLPILSKILERLIHSHISFFLEEHSLFYPLQFGFRKKHSPYMPLAHIYEEVTKSIVNGNIVCGLYLDLKKAFDTVSIPILLDKMNQLGIRGNSWNIVKSYLSNRYQCTKIEEIISERHLVKVGVPQGSILGPLLFSIYINDIANITNEAKFYLFADDTSMTIMADNVVELQRKIAEILPKITKWFSVNRLSLNATKTNYQIYSNASKNDIHIELNNLRIDRKKCIRYLGILVDENMKWDSHVLHVASTISRNIGVMGRARFYLPPRVLALLYNSLVLPYLNNCALVWGSNYLTRLDKLIKLQKRAVRIIENKPYLHPSNQLFVKLGFLKFPDIVTEQGIYVLLNHLNRSLPLPISSMFDYHIPANTRLVQHFEIPFAETNYRKFALSYMAPNSWNNIICKIFNNMDDVPRNKDTLKKHLRKYLIAIYGRNV